MPNIGTPPWKKPEYQREKEEGRKRKIEARLARGEITQEEAGLELDHEYQQEKWLRENGEDINAPACPYPLRPEYQGRLVWLTGAPGSGKSTTARLLAKQKGKSEKYFTCACRLILFF